MSFPVRQVLQKIHNISPRNFPLEVIKFTVIKEKYSPQRKEGSNLINSPTLISFVILYP